MSIMLKKIKSFIKRIIYRNRTDSKNYVRYLRRLGMQIGEGTTFIDPRNTVIDETRPWMISIGQTCCITPGVTILTHDYGWGVIKAKYGDVIGSCEKVTIGDNVYIGMNSTVRGGVIIGSNVIIGANSMVTHDIPSNVVVAGNPARVIRSIEDYYEKRKQLQLNEAVTMVKTYYSVFHRIPPVEIMREHFWLFCDSRDELSQTFDDVMKLRIGSERLTLDKFQSHQKQFKNYEEFLKYCGVL